MRRKNILVVLVSLGLMGFGICVYAGLDLIAPAPLTNVPQLIPYHGILEKDGALVNAIDAQTVSFRASLWDAPVDGSKVWPAGLDVFDEHSVNVVNGRFTFNIGEDVAYQHVLGTALYLDIQVMGAGDADFVQLGGRQRFLSAPFAIAASRSDGDFDINGAITASGPPLSIQGSAINSDDPLSLQGSSGANTTVGGNLAVAGDMTVTGDLVAGNLWTKVFEGDVPQGPWFVVSGLDNRHSMYKIFFQGYILGNAADQRLLLRPNNDAQAHYRSFVTMFGDYAGGEWEATGLYLGRSCCGYTGVINLEYNLNASNIGSLNFYVSSGSSTFFNTNGTIIKFSGGGSWGSSANITSLTLLTSGGGNFAGRLIIFGLKP